MEEGGLSQAAGSESQFREGETGAYSGQRSDRSGGGEVEMEREGGREGAGGGGCERQLPLRLQMPRARDCRCCGQQDKLDSQGS